MEKVREAKRRRIHEESESTALSGEECLLPAEQVPPKTSDPGQSEHIESSSDDDSEERSEVHGEDEFSVLWSENEYESGKDEDVGWVLILGSR
jgi:hypothetical protein